MARPNVDLHPDATAYKSPKFFVIASSLVPHAYPLHILPYLNTRSAHTSIFDGNVTAVVNRLHRQGARVTFCIVRKGDLRLMPLAIARRIEAIRVGENGRIAVPANYRKQHKLSKGSEVLLVQLGETLMVVPFDVTLDRLCERIQHALTGRGISATKALKHLPQVRRRRFQRLYGKR